jgi:endonuclease III
MAAGKRLQKIVDLLAKRYEVDGKKGELTELRDPFAVGAWYILGLHAKKNGQTRAYEALRRAKGISPGQLLDIAPEKLTTICQIAGPYDDKRAKDLYAYADEIEEKCGQDFAKIFKSQTDARKFLEVDLRRTRAFTDYVLLAGGQFPIFAVDLPIARAAARLGFGKMRDDKEFDKSYKDIQKALEAEAPKDVEWIIRAHGLLHRHGADTCKPQPACYNCPLFDECPWVKKNPPPPKPVQEPYKSHYTQGAG